MANAASRPLTRDELAASLRDWSPILTVHEAARLLGVSVSTMYKYARLPKYRHAVSSGKPLRFFRDRLVKAFFAA